MKKKILLLTLIFCALFFFSCKKNEGSKASGDAASEEGSGYNSASNAINTGYALRVNTNFFTIDNDTGSDTDKSKWAGSIALGERLETGKTRKATYTDGKVYDYVEIRRDNGTRGIATVTQIAVGGRLAVVVDEKANLYRSPKAVDVTGSIISRKTIVIYYPETESNGFVEIKAYDPETQAYIRQDNKFVRLSSLSRKESDIQSSILLQTAAPLKNEGQDKIRKDALLESALLEYPDSAFYSEIYELAHPSAVNVDVNQGGNLTEDDAE